jgi:tripartite-type tricarboxylate transporter receptor subunit TctC
VCVIEKWHAGQVSWVFVISSNKFKMLQWVPTPNLTPFVHFSPSFRKFSST